jgi:glycosyltransferase involved in cell wall biosynthesis
MTVRRTLRAPATLGRAAAVRLRTRGWPARSRLFVLGDTLAWALDDEAAYVTGVAARAGYRLAPPGWARHARRQVVFHTSHFAALDPLWTGSSHRLGLAYFHGRPGTPGFPEFDRAFAALERDPARFDRVQVTHREMEEIVISAGVAPASVHRIPIGIELARFPLGDDGSRRAARDALGLAPDAFVVGSFQKDGVGFGEGLEPKSIKGPDVLVDALEAARRELDDLVVLLTGPARGYVRRELERRSVRHVHRLLATRDELTTAYHALDAYVVASRQEGGPKSILESMATGVPLVTTRAGQAPDLVADGENGILVEVEDAEAIAASLERIHADADLSARLREAGRRTATENSHERLAPRWEALLDGFAERSGG